jgi:D-alanyl-D-alanine carboxypeptidase
MPFVTNYDLSRKLLADTIRKDVGLAFDLYVNRSSARIYSQPLDTFLRIMMHRSDNFLLNNRC